MKVVVFMSTYNGESYIKEQINSILNQTFKNIEIIIRDDGSIDGTKEILREYSKKYTNIKLIEGKNVGVSKSFSILLKYHIEADYYAFCDQDDVWLENKIDVAINKLSMFKDRPAFYYSEVTAVNNEMRVLFKSNYTGIDTLGSSFSATPAIGCTVVFNNFLKEIIEKNEISDNIIMHDLYLYRVCLAIGGTVVHDKNSYIYYRQHDNNVVGITNSIIKKMKVYDKFSKTRRIMAEDIINNYNAIISKDNKKILKKIAEYKDKLSFKEKLNYILDKNYRCYKAKSDIKFIYDVLTNRI